MHDEYEIDPVTGKLRPVELHQNTIVQTGINRNLLYTKAEVDAKIAAGGGSSTPTASYYGDVVAEAGTYNLALDTTWQQVTGFTANGDNSGVTPSYTSSNLTVAHTGEYHVMLSHAVTDNSTAVVGYVFAVYKNGTRINKLTSFIDGMLGSGTTASFCYLTAGDVLTVYAQTTINFGGTYALTHTTGLSAHYVGVGTPPAPPTGLTGQPIGLLLALTYA